MDFVIHWNETAMGLHVFPILIHPPTSLSTHLTRWMDVWIPCGDPREHPRSLPYHDMWPHIALKTQEACGVHASKRDDAWLLLKINRNPNIPVATGIEHWFSCLTSRGIHIALPSLEDNPKLSLASRQESWCHWINMNFEEPSPLYLENIPQDTATTR